MSAVPPKLPHFLILATIFLSALVNVSCRGLSESPLPPEEAPPAKLEDVKHIIFLMQENRSFDHYFGKLNDYRRANGIPGTVDGFPDTGPLPTNPDYEGTGVIEVFKMRSMCIEGVSPSWNESHVNWNRSNPVSETATMDGFVRAAAGFARFANPPLFDTEGLRSMGYYDGSDLPYYYFMYSQFATSDRWFSAVMSRTSPNRYFLISGTSAGHAYPLASGQPKLSQKTIFQLLDEHNISWKVYFTDREGSGRPATYLNDFTYSTVHPEKIVPLEEYFQDVQNNTLPAVAMIESGYLSGKDEHPGGPHIQKGSAYVAEIINALMNSPSWASSVFFLTYDEAGGIFDHVPPAPAVHPDGIPPMDLRTGDICTVTTGPNCDFVFTGFRVPLLVVSPFAKRHYVSHTPMDFTAILKFIQTRFKLPSLTARDAAQPTMLEFFDFDSPPWKTPPTPPAQEITGTCYLDRLP